MTGRVAILGYDRSQTMLVEAIEQRGHLVIEISNKVLSLADFDVVVSFGYRHILGPEVLATLKRPALNLHIAYLPYNRGAHPNFWSWIDDTPAGVSIHELDVGIDTGPICFQERYYAANSSRTLSETHTDLIAKVESLFLANINPLLDRKYSATPQASGGTYHQARDLPDWLQSWDISIEEARKRYLHA